MTGTTESRAVTEMSAAEAEGVAEMSAEMPPAATEVEGAAEMPAAPEMHPSTAEGVSAASEMHPAAMSAATAAEETMSAPAPAASTPTAAMGRIGRGREQRSEDEGGKSEFQSWHEFDSWHDSLRRRRSGTRGAMNVREVNQDNGRCGEVVPVSPGRRRAR